MSSLTWSLGRCNVSLVSPFAISSSSQQPSFRRTPCCNCALPAFSYSAIPRSLHPPTVARAPESESESLESQKSYDLLESVHLSEEAPSIDGDSSKQERLLRSLLSVLVAFAMTIGVQGAPSSRETFEDVPQTLSGDDKRHRIQKPNSAKAETCTRKCVSTCIRGGAGAPGEGPLNVRRPLVVFKEGFRSRNYCLVECSEICNLIGEGDDGP